MFISEAFAQTTATAAEADPTMATLLAWGPLVLVFAVFYFLVLRPQGQRAKQHAQMLADLKKGDKVITAGGLHATVHKVADDTLELKLGSDTMLTIERSSIAQVLDTKSKK